LDTLEPADGETFCGVHLYHPECAAGSARAQLNAGVVPRCPDCNVQAEPLAMYRILRAEDLEKYFRLTLWTNDSVAACPNCREGIYLDAGEDAAGGGRCRTATCPACRHAFCLHCRNPAHPEYLDCDEAIRSRPPVSARSRGRRTTGRRFTGGLTPGSATARSVSTSALNFSIPEFSQASSTPHLTLTDSLSSSSEVGDGMGSLAALGCKICPRCRAVVQKADQESCDHMTCAQCNHEFCWTCLADRVAIYAHGNHFHRPACRFYAPYSGPLEYLPDTCRRCAHRGAACVPPCPAATPRSAQPAWWHGLMDTLTLRSCQIIR